MGQLRDTARKNSNFFKMEKGEEQTVVFLSYRVVPSTMDPTKEAVQYKFRTSMGDKYWTNSNSQIMEFFDELKPEMTVRITRGPWINKDGSEDASKSMWHVEEVTA